MEEMLGGLRHLLTMVFLSDFAGALVMPVMTDVTVAAMCSDLNDSCSFAVYLTGIQQVAVGLGTMVMMPVIGNLADRYGIKTLLTLPMCLSIIPPGYRRDTNFFYAFYITKTLFDMVCRGTVDCLAYAYVAKNIHGMKRITMFGVLASVKLISGICATFAARFLPIASTFQVSAISLFVDLVYMRVFLKERLPDDDEDDYDDDSNHQEVHDGEDLMMLAEPILRDAPIKTHAFNTMYSSLKDMASLIMNSTILIQTLIVTFFATFSETGMESAYMYFLKARFGFNKNEFAELVLLASIIGCISQLFIFPILASAVGERKVLSTGLLMEFFRAALLSVSWSAWVPYATSVLAPGIMFVMPSVYGIASKQVASSEQGKVLGFISGVKSFAGVVAPFVYSPLTALFLSKDAPFYFPGFSLLCISLSWMIGFLQSLLIKYVPSPSLNEAINNRFAEFLVSPVMTDVTVAAVCSGLNDSCSLAVYLTGVQQVTVGLGTMVMMPVIGNLSDRYGIKALLTLPMCLSILPPAILGYRRDTNFFYASYITKTLFDIVCQGTVDCLAHAYVAKNMHGRTRISMFGVLAGVRSISGVCASVTTRFLPVALIFQVSAISAFVGLVYMRVFLKERLQDDDDDNYYDGGDLRMFGEPILKDAPTSHVFSNKYSSLKDMVNLMKNSTILVQALIVTFFAMFSQRGTESSFMYFMKFRFGFNKNDFAELFLLIWIIGSISQLFILPILVSTIGARRVLSAGLLMEFVNTVIRSVSWAAWVPYATTLLVPGAMFVMPTVCGIASRQVGSSEQGKVQGCIYGVKSLAEVVAPFVFSPLTALFLSKNAPFYFPGFSLLCVAFPLMIGLLQSLMIKDVPSLSMEKAMSNTSNGEA
ncbi:hypothetical protein AALP_AA3G328800 [Arabis alpina]|uniref:Major facilitator superfamily (MFS) profile domain-containing protein n=1 Tax=Arabis alpina TaxID=50452 RepID=A0A087HD84_ARAAL|nr:hypothetical protein AALP_AA3G328800 [Arabis alpina]